MQRLEGSAPSRDVHRRLTVAVFTGAALLFGGCGFFEPQAQTCAIEECFRGIRCVTTCGGAPVQTGCCACPAGSFDDLVCASPDGGQPDAH